MAKAACSVLPYLAPTQLCQYIFSMVSGVYLSLCIPCVVSRYTLCIPIVVSKYAYLHIPGVVARAAEGTSDRGPERGEVSLSLES